MESKIELVIILSHEINERIFRQVYEKIKKINFFVKSEFSANRIYITLEGIGEISKIIPELIENFKIYFKDYKIGVRDYYILNYELELPCDFVGTLKLPIVKAIVGNGKTCKIIFENLEKEFLERGVVERVIRLIKIKEKKGKEEIFFDNKLEVSKTKNIEGKIKKGIIKNENFYLPEAAEEISKLKEEIISNLKSKFNCKEIFIPKLLPINLMEEYNISDLIPKEALSSILSKPEKKDLLYKVFFLTGKFPKVETKSKAILFNEIPVTLFKALENSKLEKEFFYYSDYLKLNLVFFEDKNYEKLKEVLLFFFKEYLNRFGVRYRLIKNKIKLRGKEVDYFRFEVKANKWVKVIDALFPKELYTKIFKINSKSGHLTIYLDNLFLIT